MGVNTTVNRALRTERTADVVRERMEMTWAIGGCVGAGESELASTIGRVEDASVVAIAVAVG